MKYAKSILYIVLLITFNLRAFNSLPIVKIADTTTVINDSEIYTITEDKRNIFFTLSTTDPKAMMSLLHDGVSIYFDVKGKKKRNVAVTYPLIDKGSRPKPDQQGDVRGRSVQEEESFKAKIIEMLNNEIPQKASYTYYKDNKEFNVLMNNLSIAVAFEFEEERGILTYKLTIPKNRINEDASVSLSKMTIGVKSPERAERERPSGNGGGFQAGGGGRGQGGPPGGGQGGQRGGGQRGGGQRGGGGQNGGQQQQNTFNFWFDAEL